MQPTTTGATTPSPTSAWSAKALGDIKASADTCYIALFTDKCGSGGGVYKITPAWYTGHTGGAVIRQRCGQSTPVRDSAARLAFFCHGRRAVCAAAAWR